MKRLRILYAFALCLLLIQTSCNKDDEAPAPNPLIGEWELDRLKIDFAGTDGDGDYPAATFFQHYRVSFRADNSFTEEIAPVSNQFLVRITASEGEWALTNKEVTLDFDSGTDENYTLNEDNTLLTGESFNANFGSQEEPDIAAVTFVLKKKQ